MPQAGAMWGRQNESEIREVIVRTCALGSACDSQVKYAYRGFDVFSQRTTDQAAR